jgi:hypothetical protein
VQPVRMSFDESPEADALNDAEESHETGALGTVFHRAFLRSSQGACADLRRLMVARETYPIPRPRRQGRAGVRSARHLTDEPIVLRRPRPTRSSGSEWLRVPLMAECRRSRRRPARAAVPEGGRDRGRTTPVSECVIPPSPRPIDSEAARRSPATDSTLREHRLLWADHRAALTLADVALQRSDAHRPGPLPQRVLEAVLGGTLAPHDARRGSIRSVLESTNLSF